MRSKLRQNAASLLFVVAGVVFVGESVSLFLGTKTLRKAKSELAAKERRLASLANSEPAPPQARAESLVRELAELRVAISEAEWLWRDNPIAYALSDSLPPSNRRAAYLDLVRYRQALAALARAGRVEVGPDEFFGFRAYANEGPEAGDILSVHTQRLILERILEPLLCSRPERLLAVIREEVRASSERPGASKFEGVDISHRFQIRFRGATAVLRAWLNELSRAQLPILVSGVSVESGSERQIVPVRARYNPTSSSALLDDEDGFELLVKSGSSEFTVTLDYVELGQEKESEARMGEIPRFSKPSFERLMTWPEPKFQRRGPQWVFDVFTPPEIFYHPARQAFHVKPVLSPNDSAVTTHSLVGPQAGHRNAPRLLGVRREEYPLQLSGHIGGGGRDSFGDGSDRGFFGLFENRETGETLLLRGGERVDSLGIDVLNFRVEAQPIAISETMTLRAPRAAATIRDAQGERRILQEGERAEGRRLIAQVEWNAAHVELREGDVLAREDGEPLVVEEIRLTPEPSVVVQSRAVADESDDSLSADLAPLVLLVEPSPADSMH